jgi:Predicted Fe-S oxidoreductases
MDMGLFHRIADEAQDFIRHTYLHLWGEPTLNKNLPEMIRRINEFSTIDLATHGLSLNEKLAETIATCHTVSVSIDGITQEIYEKYRVGGQLKRAMEGLSLLINACAPKNLRWTFVVFKENEHQIPAAQELADKMGIRIEFKAPAFWDRSKMMDSMPNAERFRRHGFLDGKWQLKADRLKCREFWETIYVIPNGDVLTCCYDGAAQYVVGNVWENALLDIWNGEKYQAMRDKHSTGRLNQMCENYCNLAERCA